jgi:ribosome biogenesis GTPase A
MDGKLTETNESLKQKLLRISITDRAEEVFSSALEITKDNLELKGLFNLIRDSYERLHQPMRVAVVGKIKAGKSTMINALLGEYLVSTGPEELTFNVNWLKYDENSYLRVYFKDNRPTEIKSIGELDNLTCRRDENRDFLSNIKFIEVFHPNKILQTFNLIDTPGLESFFDDDSRNTLDFLQIKPEDVVKNTQRELANSDAVLYLFSQGLAVTDQAILDKIQGPAMGNTTPINSIGVLTKVDSYWPTDPEPLDAGYKISQRLMSEHTQLRNLFYAIYPVCGLLAVGAKNLSEENFQSLKRLGKLSQEEFDRLISTAKRFNNKEYLDRADIPSIEQRKNLWKKLGKYGIYLAYSLINSGVSQQQELADSLFRKSGITELLDLILSHFGNRAFLIKLSTGLRQILVACDDEARKLEIIHREIVEGIAGEFEAIQSQEHCFRELQVLSDYYKNELQLSQKEDQHLLEVTGEYGDEIWERLGSRKELTKEAMLKLATERMLYWQSKAQDVMGLNRQTLKASKVIARSYERLAYLSQL